MEQHVARQPHRMGRPRIRLHRRGHHLRIREAGLPRSLHPQARHVLPPAEEADPGVRGRRAQRHRGRGA